MSCIFCFVVMWINCYQKGRSQCKRKNIYLIRWSDKLSYIFSKSKLLFHNEVLTSLKWRPVTGEVSDSWSPWRVNLGLSNGRAFTVVETEWRRKTEFSSPTGALLSFSKRLHCDDPPFFSFDLQYSRNLRIAATTPD